mmetsp:Transcript_70446/g.184701  ORF Transcript_70446/g.184701 Transcript_70446/m.184701 type:complete len:220 (-) Transcript_70446:2-661(-)
MRAHKLEGGPLVDDDRHVLAAGGDAERALRPEGDRVDRLRVPRHLASLAARVPDQRHGSDLLAVAGREEPRGVAAPSHVLHGTVPEPVLGLLDVLALRTPQADCARDVAGEDPVPVGRHGGGRGPLRVALPAEDVLRLLRAPQPCDGPPDHVGAVAVQDPLALGVRGDLAEGASLRLRQRRHDADDLRHLRRRARRRAQGRRAMRAAREARRVRRSREA